MYCESRVDFFSSKTLVLMLNFKEKQLCTLILSEKKNFWSSNGQPSCIIISNDNEIDTNSMTESIIHI